MHSTQGGGGRDRPLTRRELRLLREAGSSVPSSTDSGAAAPAEDDLFAKTEFPRPPAASWSFAEPDATDAPTVAPPAVDPRVVESANLHPPLETQEPARPDGQGFPEWPENDTDDFLEALVQNSEHPETSDERHEGASLSDQWRHELSAHVSHAREQIDQANERLKERNERIKARSGRDLVGAIVIGVVIGAVVLVSLLMLKVAFVALAVVAGAFAVYELTVALRGAGYRVDLIPQIIAGAPLILAGYFGEPWLFWVALFVSVLVIVVCRVIGQMAAGDGRMYGDVLNDLLVGALIQVYVPFLAGIAMMLLRQDRGELWVLAFIAVVVAADTAAYASGMMFGRQGRHRMVPRISPNKTWEGFGGAVVGATIVAVLLATLMLDLPVWVGLVMGLVLVVTATLGDLIESMIKRDLGIKDMSSILPGHGGVLDRLDSILPSAVGALALFFFFSPLAA